VDGRRLRESDVRDADGRTVLNFAQAQKRARAWFAQKTRELAGDFTAQDEPYTVADAMRDYLATDWRPGRLTGSCAAN
jgi:hypothetical protein